MIELAPLFTAVVDVAPGLSLGLTPTGERTIGDIRSVTVTGERIKATLASPAAADWAIRVADIGTVDVRLTLRTHDDALILVQYGGRLDLANPKAGIFARVGARFETGDARYNWLARIHAVGKGKITVGADGARIDYEFYEVR